MDMTGLMLALAIAAPFIVLLARLSYREYGGFLGNLWTAYGEPRLDIVSRRFICVGVYAGLLVGFASAYLVMFINESIFGSDMLLFQPSEPVAWTLQIAFIQAGLVEEFAKCGLALILCFVFSLRPFSKNHDSKPSHVFYKTAPFMCAAVGLGFGIRENVDYISMGLKFSGLLPVLLGRMMASCAHLLFVLNFGLYLHVSTRQNWKVNAFWGLLVSAILHGIYDFFAFPPVWFSSLLAFVFLMLLSFFIIRRLFLYFPDLKPTYIQYSKKEYTIEETINQLRADEIEMALLARLQQNNKEEFDTMTMNTTQQLLENDFFCDSVPQISEVPYQFKESFPKYDDAKYILEKEESSGFLSTELASVLGLGSIFASNIDETSYRGEVPVQFQNNWEACEKIISLEINAKETADYVWDSSIFAKDASQTYTQLKRAGLDLENLSPFRVLEYRDVNLSQQKTIPYLYITQGLEVLYGHEFYFTFFTPMPSIRWFLLRLASILPDQAPWVQEFSPMFVKNSFDVGEPRGWWKGFLPVPLFGYQKELYETIQSKLVSISDKPPLCLLLLSVSDLTWISGFGIVSYFALLEKKQISRHNHLKRPVLTV